MLTHSDLHVVFSEFSQQFPGDRVRRSAHADGQRRHLVRETLPDSSRFLDALSHGRCRTDNLV